MQGITFFMGKETGRLNWALSIIDLSRTAHHEQVGPRVCFTLTFCHIWACCLAGLLCPFHLLEGLQHQAMATQSSQPSAG